MISDHRTILKHMSSRDSDLSKVKLGAETKRIVMTVGKTVYSGGGGDVLTQDSGDTADQTSRGYHNSRLAAPLPTSCLLRNI